MIIYTGKPYTQDLYVYIKLIKYASSLVWIA